MKNSNKVKRENTGHLINNAGHRRYTTPDSIDNLLRYITRTNGSNKNDLVSWGALGSLEFLGVDAVIDDFHSTQKLHKRKGNFGRYIDHEYFSLSNKATKIIYDLDLDIDKMARRMAYDFFNEDNCQVLYGVHAPSDADKHLHFHFAINTVNFENGNKRRENRTDTYNRSSRFQRIVLAEINKQQKELQKKPKNLLPKYCTPKQNVSIY